MEFIPECALMASNILVKSNRGPFRPNNVNLNQCKLGFSPTQSSLVSKHGPMSTYPLHTNTPSVYFPRGPFLTVASRHQHYSSRCLCKSRSVASSICCSLIPHILTSLVWAQLASSIFPRYWGRKSGWSGRFFRFLAYPAVLQHINNIRNLGRPFYCLATWGQFVELDLAVVMKAR